jgi:deoxycytidine triphosphate deaminase
MDLIKRLKNDDIGIAPFASKYIEDANVCVTASKFAWSIAEDEHGKKKCLLKKDENNREYIEIPGRESALVFSQEAIYIGENLAGICLPRVAFALSKKRGGLLCTGGPMKPARAEHLVITMHNQTDKPIEIDVGEKIAVLMFYELTTKYESTQSERELDSTIDVFLDHCLDNNSGSMLNELNNLREKYNSGSKIINGMKNGDSKADFEKFVKENDFKAILKRNKIFAIFLFLLGIQIILLFLGVLKKIQFSDDVLKIFYMTIPSTVAICSPFIAKKI